MPNAPKLRIALLLMGQGVLNEVLHYCNGYRFGDWKDAVADGVVRMVEVVNTWKLHFFQMGVSPSDVENLAQQIDGDFLLQQRKSFEPRRFVLLPTKKPRKGPFI
jgi:hypothetical protein